jgi:IPT/TIG domain-containing protein
MADYSQLPEEVLKANQQEGYVGIRFEQGKPIMDRDLTLLHDLVSATVRAVITRYIGNGASAGADGFAIQTLPAENDFRIAASADGSPGTALVGGIEVSILHPITYKSQPGVPPLTKPDTTNPLTKPDTTNRLDLVYLDVFLVEVDGTVDINLTNYQDVGLQTSVRLKPSWVVRVAQGTQTLPTAPPGHTFYPLAQMLRPNQNVIDASTTITDLRQRRLTVSDVEKRLSLVEKTLLLPAFDTVQFTPQEDGINKTVTLRGTNFNLGSLKVRFGDKDATVKESFQNRINVLVPAGLTPSGTPVQVKITVITGGGSVTSDQLFTVQPTPAFAASGGQFTPTSGPVGAQVTLNGFNFNAGSQLNVKFLQGTTPVTAQVDRRSATLAVVKVPEGIKRSPPPVTIYVANDFGDDTSTDTFTVT